MSDSTSRATTWARWSVTPRPSRDHRAAVGVPVEELARVELGDALHLVVGDVGEHLRGALAGVGPVGVRVRVAALPGEAVHTDHVAKGEARLVVDEAAPDVAAEDVGRAHVRVD